MDFGAYSGDDVEVNEYEWGTGNIINNAMNYLMLLLDYFSEEW